LFLRSYILELQIQLMVLDQLWHLVRSPARSTMPPKRQKKKSPPKASTTEEAVSGNDASGDISRSNIITGARTRKGTALSIAPSE